MNKLSDEDLSKIKLTNINAKAASEAIKAMQEKLEGQQIKINQLNNTISTLSSELSKIRQEVILLKIESSGTGPTVKT